MRVVNWLFPLRGVGVLWPNSGNTGGKEGGKTKGIGDGGDEKANPN